MADDQADHDARILDQFTRQASPFAKALKRDGAGLLDLILAATGVAADDVALDVACGPGIVTCALAEVARHVTGIDITPAMLEQARELQAEKRLTNVAWHLGKAVPLPYNDAAFSLIVARYSFHHLLDPGAALREMARVCQPGGRVSVVDVTPAEAKRAEYDRVELLRDPSHTKALTVEELRTLGAESGLVEVSITSYALETDTDRLIESSFPDPGNRELLHRTYRADVGIDHLGMCAYERNGKLLVVFPTTVIVWTKPS